MRFFVRLPNVAVLRQALIIVRTPTHAVLITMRSSQPCISDTQFCVSTKAQRTAYLAGPLRVLCKMNRLNVPIFCIFGIEYEELGKFTSSDLSLLLVNTFWTFQEFIADLKRFCADVVRSDDGDPEFKDYVASVQTENIDILEIRVNTCRGIAKAIYYDLLLLYYDERRIGDHLVNDYFRSEHTVLQVFVAVRKERKPAASSSSIHCDRPHISPSPVSATVRALVRLNMLQAWQAAYYNYRDNRIRHVLYPRLCKDNDFRRIGSVEPFRVDLRKAAVSMMDVAARKDACVLQVLAYDKMSGQSGWFDVILSVHCTLRRCKERIADLLAHIMDWADVNMESIPHLIARRYHDDQMEDFLLCDDTMTLSYLLSTESTSPTVQVQAPSTLPMLTVIAFVGREGRRISDSKGRCVFQEEEHGTQLLMAAMATYLNNYINRRPSCASVEGEDSVAKINKAISKEGQWAPSKSSGSEKSKAHAKLMAKERRLSHKASLNTDGGSRVCTCVVL